MQVVPVTGKRSSNMAQAIAYIEAGPIRWHLDRRTDKQSARNESTILLLFAPGEEMDSLRRKGRFVWRKMKISPRCTYRSFRRCSRAECGPGTYTTTKRLKNPEATYLQSLADMKLPIKPPGWPKP